jgi:hypothetical protein
MSALAYVSFSRRSLALCAAILLAPAAMPGQGQDARRLPEATQAVPPERGQVLVLDSFQYGLPVADSVNRGILAALTEGGLSISDLYVEGLDLVRRPDRRPWTNEANLLREKPAGSRFPIIIVEGALASDFLAGDGRSLFPDAALLTVLNAGVSVRDASRRVMVMSERPDYAGTLKSEPG